MKLLKPSRQVDVTSFGPSFACCKHPVNPAIPTARVLLCKRIPDVLGNAELHPSLSQEPLGQLVQEEVPF